jgi:hypothetical protein
MNSEMRKNKDHEGILPKHGKKLTIYTVIELPERLIEASAEPWSYME